MREFRGIAVSSGVAIGEIFVLDDQRRRIPRRTVPTGSVAGEVVRLERALTSSIADLNNVRAKTKDELGDEAAKIFAFHIGMLADKSLTVPMRGLIEKEGVTAEFAVWQSFSTLAERFTSLGDAAFKTKVDDVHDLCSRVLKHLIGEHASRLSNLRHRAIVVARDLTPSQAAAFNRGHVLGFVTDTGGKTGHTGIFARAIGIPAVVGCAKIFDNVQDGTSIIVDGESGLVIVDPDPQTLARYQRVQERDRLFRLKLDDLRELPCVTRDGVAIELMGNIEFPEEIDQLLAAGAVGVGLYRTEYLYLAGDAEPSEAEHFEAYSQCVRLLKGRPLTIRTMDLGADKYTQERAERPERNPMLGCRSIRYCLQNKPMFKKQLRAIVRASALGPIRVMFPLVTTPEEYRQAKFFLRDVMEDLIEEGVAFDRGLKVGMMVEVPSAAIMAEQFAAQADFFSIGTNDLVQYTLAVDRTNELVAGMYNPANPAVVRLIQETVRAAGVRKIPVSCCGESAGELEQTMLLIGLGLRSLSASAPALAALKRLIRSVTIEQCEAVARKTAELDSDAAIASFLRDSARKIIPEAFDGRSAE
jgi:phosphoenolpyruvate-protein phosphotransferase (PTS system enzyme I)